MKAKIKLLFTIPLLLTAAGAFFLASFNYYGINYCFSILLILFVVVINSKQGLSLLKNIAALFLFITPVMIGKIFMAREGQLMVFWGIKIYNSGLADVLKSWSVISLLAVISFIIIRMIYPIHEYRGKLGQNRYFSILFLSLEIYQEMLKSVGTLIRKDNHSAQVKIDNWYQAGKKSVFDPDQGKVTHQSSGS